MPRPLRPAGAGAGRRGRRSSRTARTARRRRRPPTRRCRAGPARVRSMSRSSGRMISSTPRTSPSFQSRLVLSWVVVVALDAALAHAARGGVEQRGAAFVVVDEARQRHVRRRLQVPQGLALGVVLRPAPAAGGAGAEGMLAVVPSAHAGLALADAVEQHREQGSGQGNLALGGGVVGGGLDAVAAGAVDDLRAVDLVHRFEHLGVLGGALQGRAAHQLGGEARQVPEAEGQAGHDGREQAGGELVRAAPAPDALRRPQGTGQDRLAGDEALQIRRQLGRAGIAPRRGLLHRLEADGLQVARDLVVQPVRRGAARPRSPAARACGARRGTAAPR